MSEVYLSMLLSTIKRLRKYLTLNKLKIRAIFNNVKCDSKSIIAFAASSNAVNVGDYIIGKLLVRTMLENVDTVSKSSAHLTKAASKRIK